MNYAIGYLVVVAPAVVILIILFIIGRKLSSKNSGRDWTKNLTANPSFFLELIRNPRGKSKP